MGFSGCSTQRGRSMWQCPGLLLLYFQGCLSLTGPGSVSGYVGGSLHVPCQYGKSYKDHTKYWCQEQDDKSCKTMVKINGNEKEKKSGRVSIRDHAENFTMTVTMEDLSEDDAGSYRCMIQTFFFRDFLSHDPAVLVKVHVLPATTPMETTLPATTPALPLANIEQNLRISFQLWFLLSSIHFQVLVFLKLPLFLSMLCAVFWVNSLQGIPGEV